MELKQIIFVTILCLSFCFSCSLDDDVIKSECSVSGTLKYSNDSKIWIISYVYPNTIDSVDIYIIKGYKINKSKDASFQVEATGNCWLNKDQTGIPAGTTLYNIEVKSLHYK